MGVGPDVGTPVLGDLGGTVVGEAPGADGVAGPAGKGATDMERTDVGLPAVGDLEA